jgi:hypothetical protein
MAEKPRPEERPPNRSSTKNTGASVAQGSTIRRKKTMLPVQNKHREGKVREDKVEYIIRELVRESDERSECLPVNQR